MSMLRDLDSVVFSVIRIAAVVLALLSASVSPAAYAQETGGDSGNTDVYVQYGDDAEGTRYEEGDGNIITDAVIGSDRVAKSSKTSGMPQTGRDSVAALLWCMSAASLLAAGGICVARSREL